MQKSEQSSVTKTQKVRLKKSVCLFELAAVLDFLKLLSIFPLHLQDLSMLIHATDLSPENPSPIYHSEKIQYLGFGSAIGHFQFNHNFFSLINSSSYALGC